MTHPNAGAERAISAELDRFEADLDALEQEADAFLARPKAARTPHEMLALLRRHRDFFQRLALLVVEPRGRA